MELDLSDYVQRRLYYGNYENAEARIVRDLLAPGDIAVDVGANVGLFSLIAARAVGPAGAVLAVEPVPANADALERNVQRNGYGNVKIERVAVGATVGTTKLGLTGPSEGTGARGISGTSGHYVVGGSDHTVEVPVATLDDLVARFDRPIRFLKIDIEGYEAEALAGFRRGLAQQPPHAIMLEENATANKAQDTGVGAGVLLAGLGYRLRSVGVGGRLRLPRQGGALSRLGTVRNVLALHDP